MSLPHIGYTYCIKFLPTNQVYYGSRCAKNCHPSEFWTKYFTSSKTVKNLILKYGKEAFTYEIRKSFDKNPKDAQSWERRVLKRINAGKSQHFLNKSDGVAPSLSGWKNPFFGKKHNLKTRELMSEKAKQRCANGILNMKGKKHSEETKKALSNIRKGISYEQRYGQERSKIIRQKASLKLSGSNNPQYGKIREDIIGEKNPMKREDVRIKHLTAMKNRIKITCPHCNNMMNKGSFAVHARALKNKGIIISNA